MLEQQSVPSFESFQYQIFFGYVRLEDRVSLLLEQYNQGGESSVLIAVLLPILQTYGVLHPVYW